MLVGEISPEGAYHLYGYATECLTAQMDQMKQIAFAKAMSFNAVNALTAEVVM